ncbi:hypothetical protein ROZALSC1DRAFT_25639 [Rozella allomycis CSF55]|uniref:SET domain-containing protein n=1 Tax=Rozella allomycis (strain CSF55) TaxID=988480 RepID=A0A4P9YB95_ROZAC|nr:hypothetical protein ROZALSC1DRAFT_25639 [Rozella allomycis CSF55]
METFNSYYKLKTTNRMLKVPVFCYFIKIVEEAELYDKEINLLRSCSLQAFNDAMSTTFYKNKLNHKTKSDLRVFFDLFLVPSRKMSLRQVQNMNWGVVVLERAANRELSLPLWTRYEFKPSDFDILPPHVIKQHRKRGQLYYICDGPGAMVNHNCSPLNNCTWVDEKTKLKTKHFIQNIVPLSPLQELRVTYGGDYFMPGDCKCPKHKVRSTRTSSNTPYGLAK